MRNIMKQNLKIFHLVVITLSITLSACGGGSSGGTPAANNSSGNTSENNGGQQSQQSFTATVHSLMNADENSEPMDISNANIDSDANDDETVFVTLMESMTTTP